MLRTDNIIQFDNANRNNLYPFTLSRPVSEIRIGITTIKEKWELLTCSHVSYLTIDYLSAKFPLVSSQRNLYVDASVIPNEDLVSAVSNLKENERLMSSGMMIAFWSSNIENPADIAVSKAFKDVSFNEEFIIIQNLWDIFSMNDKILRADFEIITKNRESLNVSNSNNIIGKGNIFLDARAKVEGAIINVGTGPVYIGKDAEVMEGSVIRGPFALCEGSSLKLGTKIYGATTVGPHSKVGGEINNTVFFGYSNKAHDGFIGNSVVGEWCNIGAGTNNSNLKNNYAPVKLYNYPKSRFVQTGLQFCGLFMGDHSKCGINTMFNTGTVVGFSANIYGAGFPRNFIPSFSWGGAAGFEIYQAEKAIETAEIVFGRRNLKLSQVEKDIFHQVFEITKKYRTF
jgi:UDP-N-acetylglucosamine diphosphorylase/glucosamine-1-phosphate N-acetyltransferase